MAGKDSLAATPQPPGASLTGYYASPWLQALESGLPTNRFGRISIPFIHGVRIRGRGRTGREDRPADGRSQWEGSRPRVWPGTACGGAAKRGFTVTAVDRTSFLLELARARAAQASLPVEFVLEDMRRFSRPGTFDLIINIFTSFGYFDDEADDLGALRLVRENLKSGGAVVLEMVSKERLARVFHPTTSTELANGDVLFQRHEIVDDWTRVRNHFTLIRAGAVRTFEFTHRIHSGQEMKASLIASGLASARVYGDLDGGSYDFGAQRLVTVARRCNA